MEERRSNANSGNRRPRPVHIVIVVLLLLAGGMGGILAGRWLSDRRSQSDEARLDEYLGLGERTGLTGELALNVEPMSLAIKPGEPAKVSLLLINKGTKPLSLNNWFTPAPASFDSNQLPFKVIISKDQKVLPYNGNPALFPPHDKGDFLTLAPGEQRIVNVDVSQGPGGGEWDMSAPGDYTAEIWYETYLTGKHIGVDAWTGMTNHVVVHIAVQDG